MLWSEIENLEKHSNVDVKEKKKLLRALTQKKNETGK